MAAKRGSYNKPLREEAKRQIRPLIVEEGLTYRETMQQLRLPERTFQRYISEIFLQERQLLSRKLTDDEVLNQLAILEARFSKQRRDLQTIANNPEIDARARVAAHHLIGEMAAMIYKIYSEGAPQVLTSRQSHFRQDRELSLVRHQLHSKGNPLPYVAEAYERKEEEEEQQYDELDATAEGYDELDQEEEEQ